MNNLLQYVGVICNSLLDIANSQSITIHDDDVYSAMYLHLLSSSDDIYFNLTNVSEIFTQFLKRALITEHASQNTASRYGL